MRCLPLNEVTLLGWVTERECLCPWSDRGNCKRLHLQNGRVTSSRLSSRAYHFYGYLTSLEPLFYTGGYNAEVWSPMLTYSSKFGCWDQPKICMWRIPCITAASRPCCKCQAGWLSAFLRTEWVAGWFKCPFSHNWQCLHLLTRCGTRVAFLSALNWAHHGLVSL